MVNAAVPGRVAGHAYPWDVLGDPDFPARVQGLGVGTVALAASYHSARAATPLHPRHQTVLADYAALYRPVRPGAWAGRRLAPKGPLWMVEPDPFGEAVSLLRAGGLRVAAWIVLTHNSRLGAAHPDTCVVNCFGERYPYALCPSHPEVRDYAATLAAEALRDVPVDEVSLEACGQLGLVHQCHHEKSDGAWTPDAVRLLSVCCCAACRSAWRQADLDPDRTVERLRAAVRAEALGEPVAVPEDVALLAVRHAATDALRHQVLAAVADAAPGVEVTLHAHPDPWATGASPGLTATAAADVDAVLVPVWPTTPASADLVASTAAVASTVDSYVTVLPPVDPADLPEHARRLRAAGASRLSLYHLGLVPAWRHRALRDLVELWEKLPLG
jgi:hypothetical protein